MQALVLEAEEGARDSVLSDTNFYEVTIASVDQPKLLSRLSEALVSPYVTLQLGMISIQARLLALLTCTPIAQGDLNLNICEAHAFNTLDKFSLDVFVVNGWKGEVIVKAAFSICLSTRQSQQ